MGQRSDDGQLTLIGVVIALVVVAALTGISLAVFVGSPNPGGDAQGLQGPGISQADDLSAQESLSQAQTAATTTGVAQGYGSITATSLSDSDPSVQFTSGPSTSSSVVSVASSGGATGFASTGGGGSLTLTTHAATGTCWYLWLGQGGPLYGVAPRQPSCQAVAIPSAPAVSSSASSGGWSTRAWPAA